jgi:hypothetical protein
MSNPTLVVDQGVGSCSDAGPVSSLETMLPKAHVPKDQIWRLLTMQESLASNIGVLSRATGNDRSRTSSQRWRPLTRVKREDVFLKHMTPPSQLLIPVTCKNLPVHATHRCALPRHAPFHSKSRQTSYTYVENANLHKLSQHSLSAVPQPWNDPTADGPWGREQSLAASEAKALGVWFARTDAPPAMDVLLDLASESAAKLQVPPVCHLYWYQSLQCWSSCGKRVCA